MITFEPQYLYTFSCTVAQSYAETDRQLIEGSFESYYQLTDQEVKHEILNYVTVGYVSVSDFDWKETKIDNGMLR